jgi:hypothetical protein
MIFFQNLVVVAAKTKLFQQTLWSVIVVERGRCLSVDGGTVELV